MSRNYEYILLRQNESSLNDDSIENGNEDIEKWFPDGVRFLFF